MLEFFRKYQRYFFIVIAVVIVISFSFFGTHQAINDPQKTEDYMIGHAVDGSKLMRTEMDEMIRFLWSDRTDLTLAEKGVMPNFFNDGVFRKDLLGSGIGVLLARAYFEELKEDFKKQVDKHHQFRPYCHPTAPFISVENLWAQVLPTQKANLEFFLKETHEVNPGLFTLLVDLYLGETAFPPNTLREYLLFQQKHYNWVEPDPILNRINLNLFQCRTVEDWFGSRFVELATQFISNAALIAKEKGYKVSYEEAHVDLVRNGYESLQMQKRQGDVSEEELSTLWNQQLARLHMDEKSAVHVWQKVMLFRRLFEDVGGSVFMDPHVYQTFYGFASKTAEADLYHLPKGLDLSDFTSLMQLEYYLDAVANEGRNLLGLSKTFKSIEEVERTHPELIERRFLVEVSEVKKEGVTLGVSMKEMWEWQLEKENYERLEKEFPSLALRKAQDAEQYFVALEGLTQEVRDKVDRFSRNCIVDLHPEWIQGALDQAHVVRREVSFSPSGKHLPFEGLEGAEPLVTLLSQSALKGTLETHAEALEMRKKLEMFTSDGETYYRFQVLDRDLQPRILTFIEASERGVLDPLLDAHLQVAYVKLRDNNAALFKNEESGWKPLVEVKHEVGRLLYSDLLKAIDVDAEKRGETLSSSRFENLDSFYPKRRLFSYMKEAHKDIKSLGEESSFLLVSDHLGEEGTLVSKPPLGSQWGVVKESLLFKNHEKSEWFNSDIFSMVEQSWSDVILCDSDRLSFFQLKEKSVPCGNFAAEMKHGQSILSREATHLLMLEVLDSLKEKRAIHINDNS